MYAFMCIHVREHLYICMITKTGALNLEEKYLLCNAHVHYVIVSGHMNKQVHTIYMYKQFNFYQRT